MYVCVYIYTYVCLFVTSVLAYRWVCMCVLYVCMYVSYILVFLHEPSHSFCPPPPPPLTLSHSRTHVCFLSLSLSLALAFSVVESLFIPHSSSLVLAFTPYRYNIFFFLTCPSCTRLLYVHIVANLNSLAFANAHAHAHAHANVYIHVYIHTISLSLTSTALDSHFLQPVHKHTGKRTQTRRHAHVYARTHIHNLSNTHRLHRYTLICRYVCVYVCVHVCAGLLICGYS